jgi:hypothetical protein
MKILFKRIAIVLAAVAAVVILAAGSLIVLMVYFEYPGGMGSSYGATDHDRRLTTIARTATAVIQAIDIFYRAHGQCPRMSETDFAELRAALPAGTGAEFGNKDIEFHPMNMVNGWSYFSADKDPTSCQLSHKLGWDPDLIWLRHGEQTKWVFVPGDGTDEKTIVLDIGQ